MKHSITDSEMSVNRLDTDTVNVEVIQPQPKKERVVPYNMTHNTVLRSIIMASPSDVQHRDKLLGNFKEISNANLSFTDTSRWIWDFVTNFVLKHGSVPEHTTVKIAAEDSNNSEVVGHVTALVASHPNATTGGDFIMALDSMIAKNSERIMNDILRESEEISVNGKLVVFRGKKTMMRGAVDAAKYIRWMSTRVKKTTSGVVSGASSDSEPDWPLCVKTKLGEVIPHKGRVENTNAMLDFYEIEVKYNLMSGEPEILIPDLDSCSSRIKSKSRARIKELGRKHNIGLSDQVMDEHLEELYTPYHPVNEWLDNLPAWDGEDRILELVMTLELDGYPIQLAYDLILAWMVSAVCAAQVPYTAEVGHASQGVLVLVGPGDIQKSRWLAHMVPDSKWFQGDVIFDPTERDDLMKVTRQWIVELGELDATFRKADQSAMKAFITGTKDSFRSPYGRCVESHPRRTVLCGTVNDVSFLRDETGNRKYWPIKVISCNVDALKVINLDQLWSQVLIAKKNGVNPWLESNVKVELNKAHEMFECKSATLEQFMINWEPDPTGKGRVTNPEIRDSMGGKLTNQEMRDITSHMTYKWKLTKHMAKGYARWCIRQTTDRAGVVDIAILN